METRIKKYETKLVHKKKRNKQNYNTFVFKKINL